MAIRRLVLLGRSDVCCAHADIRAASVPSLSKDRAHVHDCLAIRAIAYPTSIAIFTEGKPLELRHDQFEIPAQSQPRTFRFSDWRCGGGVGCGPKSPSTSRPRPEGTRY
jgi:hypothetical protein